MLYGRYIIQYVNDKVSKRAIKKKNSDHKNWLSCYKEEKNPADSRVSEHTAPQRIGSRPRGAECLIKAHLIIFHKIFLSGCYDSQNVRWPVINGDFHFSPPPPTCICDVILYKLFSHHALHLCAHRPHGITGTFREWDWNISVCIYARIVYCDWMVEFQLKGSRRMMSDYLFSHFKTFFDDPNKPVLLWNSQCMTDSSFRAVFVLRFVVSLI